MASMGREYPILLQSLESREALKVFEERLASIAQTNTVIAEWLAERRGVEETYAQGLHKLARRARHDGSTSMGIFTHTWQQIVEAAESRAQTHENLARKFEIDTEVPLRSFIDKNQQWQATGASRAILASLTKDLGNAQKKADKFKEKTGKNASEKAENANISVEGAHQQWNNQASSAFEQLQDLDESRVNQLRSVLTQFQTHELDGIEQDRQAAEPCLNSLLNIETADEIKAFVVRVTSDERPAPNQRRKSHVSAANLRRSSVGEDTVPPVLPFPRPTSNHSQPGEGPANEEEPARSEIGQGLTSMQSDTAGSMTDSKDVMKRPGLKSRLGTVMSRKRGAVAPSNQAPADKAKKDRNRASFMPFRRGENTKSRSNLGNESIKEEDLQADTRPGENGGPGEFMPQKIEEDTPFIITETQAARDLSSKDKSTNPANEDSAPKDSLPSGLAHELSVTPPSPVGQMDAISRAEQEALAANSESEEAIRSIKIRDMPIQEDETEAQQAMSSMANQLRAQAQNSGINRAVGNTRGRRDMRNTIFLPDPDRARDESASVAISDTNNAAAPKGAGTVLGSSNATGGPDSTPTIASPITAPVVAPGNRTISDTTSVHSGHGPGTLLTQPELLEPGLSCSIVETVSTLFSGENISKSFVVGEVTFANSPSSSSSTPVESETRTIRLDNTQMLEKVAPNPSLFSSSASSARENELKTEEATMEYRLLVSAMKPARPIVALKYQVRVDESNKSVFSPLLLRPAWQVQESQASVILFYSANPAFIVRTLATKEGEAIANDGDRRGSVTLKNVVVSICLDSSSDAGKATSAMMAPQTGAVFKRKQGQVQWKFPELTISSGEAQQDQQQKLLARFTTGESSPVRPGHVEVRWELAGRTGSKLAISTLNLPDATTNGKEASPHKADGSLADENPFADDDLGSRIGATWKQINTVRSLVSGRYTAS